MGFWFNGERSGFQATHQGPNLTSVVHWIAPSENNAVNFEIHLNYNNYICYYEMGLHLLA